MKNLIKAVTTEKRKRLEDFIFELTKVNDRKGLEAWNYQELLPRGKDTTKMSIKEWKSYLIARKEKEVNKSIEREVSKIKSVFSAGVLSSVKISIEWRKSRMWGANPKAECWYTYKKEENTDSNYITSDSISGCGYDKESIAVAQCLNQIPELLKALYSVKDANMNKNNHELFGYGSGYGILPNIEGGVGVSCYPRIMDKVGFTFETVASGKSFDVYTISKKSLKPA